ncbi:GTPase-activating protein [Saccharomycopsis crataegensis]|uniref:Protein transport protein SEC23 n=1 Tax=Saccharomycopsis crataegensis TaxID=43959 RepID=A0AAV5QLT3_9ASCO|nr:GTPase-activating protein [Saccharomycopsis crataegensis]
MSQPIIDFESIEDVDGVRLPWNSFPTSSLDAQNMAVPLSCLYTPLKEKEELVVIEDNPVMANKPSGTVLNPFCHVDYNSRTWTCPLTLSRNPLPESLIQDPEKLKMIMENTTVEYSLPKLVKFPPIYLIIIDLATDYENLASLKDSILASLGILPENSLICLMTFGKHVNIYELTSNNTNSITCHSFNGEKLYALREVRDKLGLLSSDLRSPKLGENKQHIGSKFFQPLQHCEFQIQLILDNLLQDSFKYSSTKQRKLRSTGSCLSFAFNLLELCFPKTGVEILAFLSGPCNYGKFGKITSDQLKDHLRSHKDIQNGNKNYQVSSRIFYDDLAKRASKHGYITNFFIGSLDQVGLFEMASLSDKSGGSIIFSDSFGTSIFKNSFIKFLQNQTLNFDDDEEDHESNNNNNTTYGLNGSLEVKTSKNLKINGLIGHAVSLNKTESNDVSDKVVGIGGTSSWKLPKILTNSTYAIYFEMNKNLNNAQQQGNESTFIQFLCYYQHPDGNFRLRVTTISRPIYNFNTSKELFVNSFDQEAAIIALVREVSFKIFKEVQEPAKVREQLDTALVNLMKTFATVNSGAANKLEINSNFSMFPQFVYNLRRSFLLRLFNYSPDESAYYNHTLNHEDVNNSLIIIQPVLLSYEQDSNNPEETIIEPVLLDSVSIKPTRILLLDSYFEVLIYHGEIISNWKNHGYQDQPEYEHFKNFLQLPKKEVTSILIERFPLPRYIDCDEGGSQSRFLYSKLNPSNSYNNQNLQGGGGSVILTDDVSLQSFIEEITKRVISK